MELLARPFTWPDVRGARTLVIGLGGGADAITAYAIAGMLDAGTDGVVAYGNTKHEIEPDLIAISPRIGRLPDSAARGGKTKIERRLPRGPLGSPLVIALGREDAPQHLSAELAGLGVDRVIGVDTGGDALDASPRGNRGRDRRMLEVLRRLGVPTLLVVVAPGADGQVTAAVIEAWCAAEATAGRYRGSFSLEPLVPVLREHGRELTATRTPNIICRAFDEVEDPVTVPRGCRPRIPRHWLTSGLVFDAF